MHILSPETDNYPSWISGRERMTIENISRSISTKECCRPRRGLNPRPLGLQLNGASNWATEAGHTISMHEPSLVKIHWYLLKLSFWNKNIEMSWAYATVKDWQNLPISNPKPDLHNINAHTKFGENPLIFTQVIIWKGNYRWTDEWQTNKWTDRQMETWTINVIP